MRPDHSLFESAHLPPHLAEVSHLFAQLAYRLWYSLPVGIEGDLCLRKLLEAKDCAVRAMVLEHRGAAFLEAARIKTEDA